MLEHIETIFEDRKLFMNNLKPETYKKNMKQFREHYKHFLVEMTDFVEKAEGDEEKKEAAMEVGRILVYSVQKKYVSGRNKKIKPALQLEINSFMVHYVFPALLMTEHKDAEIVAQGICKVWGDTFEHSRIGYTDYETIYSGFRTKPFGLL